MTTEPISVRVFDIVGGPLGVSVNDGQRLYDKIFPLLGVGTPVVLSFKDVDTIITAFLNAAVGQLYREFSEDRIRQLLTVADLDPDGAEMVNQVFENAKRYYSNPEDFDRAWEEEVGDGDEE